MVDLLFGETDQSHAPHRAEGANRAFTKCFRHPRLGNVQQARQFAGAQQRQVVAGSGEVYGHVPSCRCQRADTE